MTMCAFCKRRFTLTEMSQCYCDEACADAANGIYDGLDPDYWCLRHGKRLPAECARYCEDCEPPEPDGEAFRGGEAAAYEHERQAWIQRNLK